MAPQSRWRETAYRVGLGGLALLGILAVVAWLAGWRLPGAFHLPLLVGSTAFASILALRPPRSNTRRALSVLLLAPGVLLVGLPAPFRPLFPWLDLAQPRALAWEQAFLIGLYLLLAFRAAPGESRPRWTRAPALLGLVLVAVVLLVPTKFTLNVLTTPLAGESSVPVFLHGEPVQMHWGRVVLDGHNALRLTSNLALNAWSLADVARGIGATSGEPISVLPRFLWTALKGLAGLLLALRALGLPFLALTTALSLAGRTGPALLRRAEHLLLLVLLLAEPLFNLGSGLVALLMGRAGPGTVGNLLAALALLFVVALVEGARASAGKAPSGTLPLVVLLGLAACSPSGEAPSPPPAASADAGAPDILLVGVAGLRSDPVSGSADRFRAGFGHSEATYFSQAYVQSPSPFVSLGSMLTGRYPSAIPLCGFTSAPEQEGPQPWCTELPTDVHNLPEVAAVYGWHTAFLAANLQGAQNLGRAFQAAKSLENNARDARTDWTALGDEALALWKAQTGPRLLQVAVADLMVLQRPGLLREMGVARPPPDLLTMALPPPVPDRAQSCRAYGQEAERVGLELGRFVDRIRAASQTETGARPTWVFVFGTNGLIFGEARGVPWQVPRRYSWNDILVDRTLHVPLLVVPPVADQPGRQVDGIVEMVDLFPTVAALAGFVAPAGLPGHDLLATAGPDDPLATAYAEFGDQLSVRRGDLMFAIRGYFYNRSSLDPELTDFARDPALDPHRHFLHILSRDPFQERNEVEARGESARQLQQVLLEKRTGPGAPAPAATDARRVWELRMTESQGYW